MSKFIAVLVSRVQLNTFGVLEGSPTDIVKKDYLNIAIHKESEWKFSGSDGSE
jgi:hypothetical protein